MKRFLCYSIVILSLIGYSVDSACPPKDELKTRVTPKFFILSNDGKRILRFNTKLILPQTQNIPPHHNNVMPTLDTSQRQTLPEMESEKLISLDIPDGLPLANAMPSSQLTKIAPMPIPDMTVPRQVKITIRQNSLTLSNLLTDILELLSEKNSHQCQ